MSAIALPLVPPDWLTVKEFADLARYHPKSVYRKIANHEIDGVRQIGRSIRINRRIALRLVRSDRQARL